MRAIISLGSNFGEREKYITDATQAMCELGEVKRDSGLYESPAIDGVSFPYINSVIELDTSLSNEELERKIKELETRLGRDRAKFPHNIVPIDIDLVIFGDSIIRPVDYSREYFRRGYSIIGQF
ncbi:MAG: 2-amino-4-hydroxy-6-hydroxymethyldihydropteridine diphosphokinase [Muribaculaceae bacterium]|nr:2-amino-4-hydroxy-6-hydroxymethyldihydropteridine diphosphokinase [Muribaculaceae bacterium]